MADLAKVMGLDVPAAVAPGPTIVRKTADETVNNNNTPQNDDHLLLAVAANEVWELTLLLLITQTVANGDWRFGFSVPAGTTMRFCQMRSVYPTASSDKDQTDVQEVDTEAGVNNLVFLKGIIIVSATAGNVNLQWSQKNAVVGDNTVLTNSCLIAHQIA